MRKLRVGGARHRSLEDKGILKSVFVVRNPRCFYLPRSTGKIAVRVGLVQ